MKMQTNMDEITLPASEVTVLYCEDDEQTRLRMHRYLARRFTNIHVANNGAEGLELFSKYQPQLIISDIRMPEVGGLEMCRAIREQGSDVAIIIISAHDEASFLHSSIDLGVSKYLVKPVNLNMLMDTVDTLVTKISQQNSLLTSPDSAYSEQQYEQEKVHRYVSKFMDDFSHVDSPDIRHLKIAKGVVSGDFYCISEYKNSRYIMVADGCGHGLPAIMPALQIPEVFKRLVHKGYSLLTIADEINTLLFKQEISEHFVATTLICMNTSENFIEVLNCGNPAAVLINEEGELLQEFKSTSLALGAVDNENADFESNYFQCHDDARLYVFSDGLTDTLQDYDSDLNFENFNSLFTEQASDRTFDNICHRVEQAIEHNQPDDVTVLEALFYPSKAIGHDNSGPLACSVLSTFSSRNDFESEKLDLKTYSVLIVEDDEHTRKTMAQILSRRLGMVYMAKDQRDGIHLFEKYQPSIVISDLHFYDSDGVEMIKEMHDISPQVPVIVISGSSGTMNVEKLFEIGVKRYHRKPVVTDRLIDSITSCLNNRKENDEQELSSSVFLTSSLAITITDSNKEFMAVNPAFCDITGYSQEEVIGRNPRLLSSGKHNQEFYQDMWNAINTENKWSGEVWNRRKNGELFLEWITINAVLNAQGEVTHYFSVFADITERKAAEEAVRKLTFHDGLTNLPNRRLFLDRLEQEIKKAERNNEILAVLFLDLDNFKDVNDTLGHRAGDDLLQQAARRLAECIRDSDTVARMGGDEFTIFLSDLHSLKNIDGVIDKILKKMVEPFLIDDELCYLSVSIGVTFYPDDANNIEDLLKNADQAMYSAKTDGRNCAHYFKASMQEEALARKDMINDLRLAMEAKDQFEVYYQPIIEMATGSIHKAEALIRWQHPKRGFISPAEFIPIAEDTKMIIDIGNWVFQQAVQQVSIWKELYHKDFQISINKSPKQFQSECDSHQEWFDYLNENNVPEQGIVVEITEGLLMDASTEITDQLLSFRDAGMQVALDDFGTGYSSLSYLRKFDIDYLKIDQSFVNNLTESKDDQVLCEAIIVMAHKLGIKVIAEGIETEQQRKLLLDAGCDYGQGFLFSKPVPSEEFQELITAG